MTARSRTKTSYGRPWLPQSGDDGLPEDLEREAEELRNAMAAGWAEDLENLVQKKLVMKKVVEAQEAEKRRIAQDIHDEAEQLLGAAIFRLDMCLVQLPEAATAVEGDLQRIRDILIESVDSLQRLSYDLRPPVLDNLGLEATLSWFFRTSGLNDRLNLHWHVEPFEGRLHPMVETALFRIIQEACQNVLKHAQAKNLHVEVQLDHGGVTLTISDDGVGFDPETVWSRHCLDRDSIPMGLTGMKERAELLGGRLMIRSTPRHGTRIVVKMPFTPQG